MGAILEVQRPLRTAGWRYAAITSARVRRKRSFSSGVEIVTRMPSLLNGVSRHPALEAEVDLVGAFTDRQVDEVGLRAGSFQPVA